MPIDITNIRVYKIKTEKEQDKKHKITKFYVNDIFVCECEVGGDYYYTVSKSSIPFNILDK